MWSTIFVFLSVAMIAVLIAGLARPQWFANGKTDEVPKRSELAAGSIFLVLIFAGLASFLGRTAETQPARPPAVKSSTTPSKKAEEIEPWIKPESIVQFPKGEIACRSSDDLRDAFLLGATGRDTKMNAYFQDQDGSGARCLMLPSNLDFKVIDAEVRDSSGMPDALLLEVVGTNVEAADEGAYVTVLDRSMAKIVR
jgi:hypothetical protein